MDFPRKRAAALAALFYGTRDVPDAQVIAGENCGAAERSIVEVSVAFKAPEKVDAARGFTTAEPLAFNVAVPLKSASTVSLPAISSVPAVMVKMPAAEPSCTPPASFSVCEPLFVKVDVVGDHRRHHRGRQCRKDICLDTGSHPVCQNENLCSVIGFHDSDIVTAELFTDMIDGHVSVFGYDLTSHCGSFPSEPSGQLWFPPPSHRAEKRFRVRSSCFFR